VSLCLPTLIPIDLDFAFVSAIVGSSDTTSGFERKRQQILKLLYDGNFIAMK
jgi:hypothetical protein